MDEVRRQAAQAGANEMVISTLTHNIDHHEYDRGGYTQHFFIVSMHVLGTAIASARTSLIRLRWACR